jgi:hypothetical protein
MCLAYTYELLLMVIQQASGCAYQAAHLLSLSAPSWGLFSFPKAFSVPRSFVLQISWNWATGRRSNNGGEKKILWCTVLCYERNTVVTWESMMSNGRALMRFSYSTLKFLVPTLSLSISLKYTIFECENWSRDQHHPPLFLLCQMSRPSKTTIRISRRRIRAGQARSTLI